MGKVRKKCAARVHISAAKVSSNELRDDHHGRETGPMATVAPIPVDFMTKQSFVSLQEHGARDRQIKSSDDKQLSQTKKDKRKRRHQTWLQKIEGCKIAEQAKKAEERRKKTVIVGDLQPLLMSLPGVVDIQEKKEVESKSQSAEQPQKNIFKEVDLFQQVLNHPAFSSNPLETISEHLENVVSVNKL